MERGIMEAVNLIRREIDLEQFVEGAIIIDTCCARMLHCASAQFSNLSSFLLHVLCPSESQCNGLPLQLTNPII